MTDFVKNTSDLIYQDSLSQADFGDSIQHLALETKYAPKKLIDLKNKLLKEKDKGLVLWFDGMPGWGKSFTSYNTLLPAWVELSLFTFILSPSVELGQQAVDEIEQALVVENIPSRTKDGRRVSDPKLIKASDVRDAVEQIKYDSTLKDKSSIYVICYQSIGSKSDTDDSVRDSLISLAHYANGHGKLMTILADECHRFMTPYSKDGEISQDQLLKSLRNNGVEAPTKAGVDRAFVDLSRLPNVLVYACTATPTPYQIGLYDHDLTEWVYVGDASENASKEFAKRNKVERGTFIEKPTTVFYSPKGITTIPEDVIKEQDGEYEAAIEELFLRDACSVALNLTIANFLKTSGFEQSTHIATIERCKGGVSGYYTGMSNSKSVESSEDVYNRLVELTKRYQGRVFKLSDISTYVPHTGIEQLVDIIGDVDIKLELGAIAKIGTKNGLELTSVDDSGNVITHAPSKTPNDWKLMKSKISVGEISNYVAVFKGNEGVNMPELNSVYHLRMHNNKDNINRRIRQIFLRSRAFFGSWEAVKEETVELCSSVRDVNLRNLYRQFIVSANECFYTGVDNETNVDAIEETKKAITLSSEILIPPTFKVGNVEFQANRIANLISTQKEGSGSVYTFETNITTLDGMYAMKLKASDATRKEGLEGVVTPKISINTLDQIFGFDNIVYEIFEDTVEDIIEETFGMV